MSLQAESQAGEDKVPLDALAKQGKRKESKRPTLFREGLEKETAVLIGRTATTKTVYLFSSFMPCFLVGFSIGHSLIRHA